MKKVLILVVVVVLGVIAFGLNRAGLLPWAKAPVPAPGPSSSASTAEEDLKELRATKRVVTIPSVSARKEISFAALPANLQSLFSAEDTLTSVEALTFTNGAMGFSIQYASQSSVALEYLDFLDKWAALGFSAVSSAARRDTVAFVNMENGLYTLEAEFVAGASTSSTKATLTILIK